MSNFRMTWKDHAPTVAAARRKVMTPSVVLPDPIGDRGKLPPQLMAIRWKAHQDLRASLARLKESAA